MKELKNRIRSVKTTRKITKAMQLVATSHLRKARDHILSAHRYIDTVDNILITMNKEDLTSLPPLLVGRGKQEKHLLIACTANRGLCGAFNSSIIRTIKKEIERLAAEGKQVMIYAIGKRGHSYLQQFYPELLLPSIIDVTNHGIIHAEQVEKVTDDILDMFEQEKFDVCTILYSASQSTLVQTPQLQQLIPALKENIDAQTQYEFDSSSQNFLDELSNRNFSAQIYKALLQNVIAEHSARMSAMDNATRNSEQLMKKLNLIYNRTRQQQITNELIEIISGSEAT